MFYSVETKRLLIWKCQRHYLIITRIITSKWDNFSKSDKNLSTFVSTLANFWKFFVRNTSSALYHFSYFSRIDYFSHHVSLALVHGCIIHKKVALQNNETTTFQGQKSRLSQIIFKKKNLNATNDTTYYFLELS